MRTCKDCEANPIAHFDSGQCWTCYHVAQVLRDRKDTSIQKAKRTQPDAEQEVAPPDPWSTHPRHPF